MKKSYIIIGIVLLCSIVVATIYLITNYYPSKKATVMIENNISNLDVNLKTKYISAEEDIRKIDEFVNELKPLSDDEMINIVVTEDIVIKYKDKVTIILLEGRKGICAYTLANSEQTHLSYMPEGMYEWVIEKLK